MLYLQVNFVYTQNAILSVRYLARRLPVVRPVAHSIVNWLSKHSIIALESWLNAHRIAFRIGQAGIFRHKREVGAQARIIFQSLAFCVMQPVAQGRNQSIKYCMRGGRICAYCPTQAADCAPVLIACIFTDCRLFS